MKHDLEWNVFRHDFNSNSIELLNVFDHTRYRNEVLELLKRGMAFDDFSEKLKSISRYYYWSKCEYEVVITSFPPYVSKKEIERLCNKDTKYRSFVNLDMGEKVDIYRQLEINWEKFARYVWKWWDSYGS